MIKDVVNVILLSIIVILTFYYYCVLFFKKININWPGRIIIIVFFLIIIINFKNMLDWFSSNGYLALSKTDKSKLTMKCIMKPDANHYTLDSLSDDPVLIAIPKKMLGKNIETGISKQIVQRGTKNINTEYLVSLTDPKQNVLKNNETSYSARFSLRFGTDNKECLSFIEANPCLKNSATQGKTEEDVLIDCLKN